MLMNLSYGMYVIQAWVYAELFKLVIHFINLYDPDILIYLFRVVLFFFSFLNFSLMCTIFCLQVTLFLDQIKFNSSLMYIVT